MRFRRVLICLLALLVALGMGAAPKKKAKKKKVLPKHYIDMYAGVGVSGLGYDLLNGRTLPTASFTLGGGYTWFFRPYMGLQTGFHFTRYAANAQLTDRMEWPGQTDTDNQPYTHLVDFDNWHEVQQSYMLSLPIGLRFRYRKNQDQRAGLHAAFGVQLAIPLVSNYVHKAGSVIHSAWYEQWQLYLHDIPGRFETEPFTTRQEESIQRRLNPINLGTYAELGTTIRLNERSDMIIAAYVHYLLNSLSAVKRDERVPLGFANEHNGYSFMPEYRGLVGTTQVGAMHPWTAGVKLQLSIWPGQTERQKKRVLRRLVKQYPELAPTQYIHDTTILYDTILLHDTIYIERTPVPSEGAVKIDSLLREAVIWFHFDKYDPILEPEWLLDSVAMMMQRYPSLRLQVNGHACVIGGDAYNRQLALKRAKAVAAILRRKGVAAKRMTVQSFGASHPYRYNAEHQLSKDRRVEIIPEDTKDD